MTGLYVHIPFCNSICSYCDFVKMVARTPLKEQYVNALIKEIDLKKQRLLRNNYIDTIYIGGGTPSSLPLYLLDKLLTELDNIYNINNIKEYTIELNTPYGTAEADREIIESLKEVGFVVIPNTASMNKFYIKW